MVPQEPMNDVSALPLWQIPSARHIASHSEANDGKMQKGLRSILLRTIRF